MPIPKEIKTEVLNIAKNFNQEHKTNFIVTFRGNFAYLTKITFVESKLGRLKYNGSMNDWSFVVYKYSRDSYDPNEFMFPGSEELNGTIEGALKAGLSLYPD